MKFGKKFGPCVGESGNQFIPQMAECKAHGLVLEVVRHERPDEDTRRALLRISTNNKIILQDKPLYVRISFSHHLINNDKPTAEETLTHGNGSHSSIDTLVNMARPTERVFEISDDDDLEDTSYFWFTYDNNTQLDFCFADVQCWKEKNAFLPPDISRWSSIEQDGVFTFDPNNWNKFHEEGFLYEAEVNITLCQ